MSDQSMPRRKPSLELPPPKTKPPCGPIISVAPKLAPTVAIQTPTSTPPVEVVAPSARTDVATSPKIKVKASASVEKKVTQHLTSIEEMNTRLQRDPHDAVVIVAVQQIQRLMNQEGLSQAEALTAYFADNKRLNERVATRATYTSEKQNELRRLTATFIGFSLLVGCFLFYIYDHNARLPLMQCLGLLLAALCTLYKCLSLDRSLQRHPFAVMFALALAGYGTFVTCLSGVKYILNPTIPFWVYLRAFGTPFFLVAPDVRTIGPTPGLGVVLSVACLAFTGIAFWWARQMRGLRVSACFVIALSVLLPMTLISKQIERRHLKEEAWKQAADTAWLTANFKGWVDPNASAAILRIEDISKRQERLMALRGQGLSCLKRMSDLAERGQSGIPVKEAWTLDFNQLPIGLLDQSASFNRACDFIGPEAYPYVSGARVYLKLTL